MGSGKSVAATLLVELLNREKVSTDQMIEAKAGAKISKIFESFGESYFRKVERDIVSEVAKCQNVIIDCGGGVVLDKANVANLKKSGILIYLSASAKVIFERVKNTSRRPLLQVDDPLKRIKALLKEREKYYAQADYTIDTDGKSNEQVCDEILKLISN